MQHLDSDDKKDCFGYQDSPHSAYTRFRYQSRIRQAYQPSGTDIYWKIGLGVDDADKAGKYLQSQGIGNNGGHQLTGWGNSRQFEEFAAAASAAAAS